MAKLTGISDEGDLACQQRRGMKNENENENEEDEDATTRATTTTVGVCVEKGKRVCDDGKVRKGTRTR